MNQVEPLETFLQLIADFGITCQKLRTLRPFPGLQGQQVFLHGSRHDGVLG
jgi:hypothetical protein